MQRNCIFQNLLKTSYYFYLLHCKKEYLCYCFIISNMRCKVPPISIEWKNNTGYLNWWLIINNFLHYSRIAFRVIFPTSADVKDPVVLPSCLRYNQINKWFNIIAFLLWNIFCFCLEITILFFFHDCIFYVFIIDNDNSIYILWKIWKLYILYRTIIVTLYCDITCF